MCCQRCTTFIYMYCINRPDIHQTAAENSRGRCQSEECFLTIPPIFSEPDALFVCDFAISDATT